MIAHKFSPERHYKIVEKWWHDHADWVPIPLEMLPELGIVVYDGTAPICAGFLYRTDSAFCMIEHIVSDPESSYLIRSRALDVLIKSLMSHTSKDEVVITWLQHMGLIERFEKAHGFKQGDKNMTALLRQGGE